MNFFEILGIITYSLFAILTTIGFVIWLIEKIKYKPIAERMHYLYVVLKNKDIYYGGEQVTLLNVVADNNMSIKLKLQSKNGFEIETNLASISINEKEQTEGENK